MSEIEYPVFVNSGFGDVEIWAEEMDYEGVEEPVNEFFEELDSFFEVRAGHFGGCGIICRGKPWDIGDLIVRENFGWQYPYVFEYRVEWDVFESADSHYLLDS